MFLRSAAAGRPGWFSVWEGKCAASNGALPLRGQRKNARLKLRASRDVDVSVLRFTLGIPGFDDSKLPRILGFTFGGLIVVNHIFSQLVPPAQLRSEGVGLFLSVVAVLLPSLRKLELDGQSSRAGSLPSDLSQVFVMAEWLTDAQKQELAWVSYALIRNTKTIAVIAFHGDEIVLARGCWNLPRVDNGDPETPLKILQALLHSFLQELKSKRTIYVPSGAGDSGLSFIPKGLNSLLAQSFSSGDGGLLLVSDVPRAYNVKDRTWIQCLAEKMNPEARSTNKLQKSSERIKEMKKAMAESEEMGASILQQLHAQRDQLLHAKNKTMEMNENLKKSDKVLGSTEKRNKWGVLSFFFP